MADRVADLLDRDYAQALEIVVGPWLDKLDTRLGTADAVRWLKAQRVCLSGQSCTTSCEDGPYSDGGNPEWWSFKLDERKDGFDIEVRHTRRRGHVTTVLRRGRMTWNNLANRATITALDRRYAYLQMRLFR